MLLLRIWERKPSVPTMCFLRSGSDRNPLTAEASLKLDWFAHPSVLFQILTNWHLGRAQWLDRTPWSELTENSLEIRQRHIPFLMTLCPLVSVLCWDRGRMNTLTSFFPYSLLLWQREVTSFLSSKLLKLHHFFHCLRIKVHKWNTILTSLENVLLYSQFKGNPYNLRLWVLIVLIDHKFVCGGMFLFSSNRSESFSWSHHYGSTEALCLSKTPSCHHQREPWLYSLELIICSILF